MKTIKFCLLLVCLSYLVSCGQLVNNPLDSDSNLLSDRFSNRIKLVSLDATNSNLAETATPKIIKELNKDLEQFTPQVKIISPQAEQVFNKTDISVKLQVEDLPIFQDDKLKLGNHLDLILDNEPSQPIYDLDEPIILKNLTPGTHSIRVFASRPWGESFKNDGAYAQTTFSVLTETNDNRPAPNLPLLTYSKPTGIYGAEPFMLDFYLTNAPLHVIAQNNPGLKDWRIRATVNGTSFILENWQPIYLTGFNKGKNWIQLELIDETGNNIENTFNNTVRVIDYDPQQKDTLAKLVTNKIPRTEARSIVEPKYYIQPVGTPEIIEPEVEPENNDIEPEIISEESVDTIEPEAEAEAPEVNITTEEEIEETVISPDKEVKETLVEIPSAKTRETEPEKPAVQTTEVESEKSTETITMDKVDSATEEPIATIDIPQPESVEITEDQIATTLPEIEPTNTSEPQQKSKTPLWLKKILVGLRQKIEALAKLLPSAV